MDVSKNTHYQFENLIYSFEKFVDFDEVLNRCSSKSFIKKNREKVIKNCSIKNFNKALIIKLIIFYKIVFEDIRHINQETKSIIEDNI